MIEMDKQISSVACTVCAQCKVSTVLDFGLQPLASQFLENPLARDLEFLHPLQLGICAYCSTIQLSSRMPAQIRALKPSWLIYHEPERHLDEVAHTISNLMPPRDPVMCVGLSYIDQSLLNRLQAIPRYDTHILTEEQFSRLRSPCLSRDSLSQLPQANLIIARYVLEHVEDALEWMEQCKSILLPHGILYLEVPDCTKFLRNKNYAFVWEEHLTYFTEETLQYLAARAGAEVVWFQRYSYDFEDALGMAWKFTEEPKSLTAPSGHTLELASFASTFPAISQQWRQSLQQYRARGERIAVFGAGHLAVRWINFHDLGDQIDCIIDDHPKKIGCYLPGSHLPIHSSDILSRGTIQVCISILSPESDLKVRNKLGAYFANGGQWVSAFARDSQARV